MITSGSRNERKNEQQGDCHKITRGDSKNSEPERPFALPKHLVGADRAYLNALFDFSLAGSRFSSDFRRCRCRRPNSDVLARKRDGWGLLQVPQAPPSPLAPSPGRAFLCGTNPCACRKPRPFDVMKESRNVGHDGRAALLPFEVVGCAVQTDQPT